MTREQLSSSLLKSKSNNYLLELSTGVGKTKLALDKLNSLSPNSILIVVPRNVLKNNWKEEIKKWRYEHLLPNITFTTYVSIHKYISNWDVVIFDEAHHITDNVMMYIKDIVANYNMYLSATLPDHIKRNIKLLHGDISHYTIDISDAVSANILPEPKVILKGLNIKDFNNIECTFTLGKKTGTPKTVTYKEYKRFLGKYRLTIKCTPAECLELYDTNVSYWRYTFESTGSEIAKNKYLMTAKRRLEFLAKLKTDIIKKYLDSIRARSLVFCADIEQCDSIRPKSAVHSKNKKAADIINAFNEGTIKTITSCNMLNEGISLKECEYGVFAYINASEIISKQKIGRILRHPNPKIVLFYFADTREEELVQRLLDNLQ